jgi:threonylcarbamoyladenosine tRNA methylthiotransferase MtaB
VAEYHVENFGCRASQADGASIAAQLDRLGLTPSASLDSANVVILNTCSVTAEADRQARAYIRRAQSLNPAVRVLVTGCYAQRAPDEVAALAGVDRVIGNSHKGRVAEMAASLAATSKRDLPNLPGFVPVDRLTEAAPVLVDDSFAHAELAFLAPGGFTHDAPGRHLTRPNLKVQDGCGNRCSFCIIPQTRGGSRSISLDKVLAGVRAFVESGGQEMVLSGINLGRWGRDFPVARRFEDLVLAILEQTELPRLRISSVEPMDWTERLLDLYRSFGNGQHPRLARHAHLPLQSGSDAVLRSMYRRYRPWHYAAKLQSIREAMPDAAIGADVMVGFPGETDLLFEESYRFIEQQPFTYLHLFPFSARPGTPAWKLHREKPVHGQAVHERMARLRTLIDEKNLRFRQQFLNRELSVVTLQSEPASAATRAISDNFLTVETVPGIAANRMLTVKVDDVTANGLSGISAGSAVRSAGQTRDYDDLGTSAAAAHASYEEDQNGILVGQGPSHCVREPISEEHHR